MRILIWLILCLVVAAPAEARWRVATSDHFVIYSEESPKSLEAFATKLERVDKAMRVQRSVPDFKPAPGNRLTIFVVPERQIGRLYGKGGRNVGGFYMGRASGSFAITPRDSGRFSEFELSAQIVLFHEYAHHFMMENYSAAFPAWFIEGFAEFYSTAKFEKDGAVGLGLPALHRGPVLMNQEIKAERLLSAAVRDLPPDERALLYGRGWLLTHFLSFEESRNGQLDAYIKAVNAGTPSVDAARQAFGDLKKLDADLDRYLRRPKFSYHKMLPHALAIGPIAVRELGEAENAVMEVRIRLKRGVDEKEAAELLPLARKAATPYPKDAFAQVTLAEAEFAAGNIAEAEAAADRALAADPKAVEALIYKGRARMALAEKTGAEADEWKKVRSWFLAANKLEPEDPEPLMLFYQSFRAAGEAPSANASKGLQYALVLAPQDMELRWMAAQQLLRDSKAAEARTALAPLAFDPHGGPPAEAAAAIVAAIDGGGAEAGLAVLQKLPPEAFKEKEPGAEPAHSRSTVTSTSGVAS